MRTGMAGLIAVAAFLFVALPAQGAAPPAPKKAPPPAPPAKHVVPGKATGVLEIASMTPGAQVFIDGALKGTIPFDSVEFETGQLSAARQEAGSS